MLCNVITTYLVPTFWCTGLAVEGTAHRSNSHRRPCIAIHLPQRHLLGMWVNYPYNIQGGHIRHARDDTSRWHQQSAHCEQIKDLVLVLRMRFCIYLYRWVANSVPGQMDNSHSSQATNSIPRHMDYSLPRHMGYVLPIQVTNCLLRWVTNFLPRHMGYSLQAQITNSLQRHMGYSLSG